MTVWIQNPFDNLPGEGYRKQRYWLMAEAFAAAGHRVLFWTSDFSHATKQRRRLVRQTEFAFGSGGLDVRLLPTEPYLRNVSLARIHSHRAYAQTFLSAAAAESVPDLIVTSVPSLSAATACLNFGHAKGAKVVVDVMDAWPETFERLAPRGTRFLFRRLLSPLKRQARRLYREADLVTGVSERYRALTGREDYFLAYHGVELGPAFSAEPRKEDGRIRLVYAGTIGRTYDLDTVFSSVAANPDFTLDIAGRWERSVPSRVKVHGYLDSNALQGLLATCDVGIIPMDGDSWVGVPYKFCDYAKAGLGIVSSLGGETGELLSRYRCGAAYRPGDSSSFAAAVRRTLQLERCASRRMCEGLFDANRIYAGYVCHIDRELIFP